jgi:hypothetical protein
MINRQHLDIQAAHNITYTSRLLCIFVVTAQGVAEKR